LKLETNEKKGIKMQHEINADLIFVNFDAGFSIDELVL